MLLCNTVQAGQPALGMSRLIRHSHQSATLNACTLLVLVLIGLSYCPSANALRAAQWQSLQKDTAQIFWHGFDGYMEYAYPEDELRSLSCRPMTRDFENQNNWEINDPLPNYTLTLIDSLSTLAVLASSSESEESRKRALTQFQNGIQALVELYGDGSAGEAGQGVRSRGFDIDSKVQVFETTIRGLGGLLSAHLFAVGELPIRGYHPTALRDQTQTGSDGIKWTKQFSYDGQMLRLAYDLGQRLAVAFNTQTGIPYPRVNLRHGIPFYRNAYQNCESDPPEDDFGDLRQCPASPQADDENTQTCSAGAGSLVLEFTVLSRLSGNGLFETMAKRAFWAVWDQRSQSSGLVGSDIDAETGEWKGYGSTGIGASIDSFYEYAAKSYILLSGTLPKPPSGRNTTVSRFEAPHLSEFEDSSDGFLHAWQSSQEAIRRYVYNDENVDHPYYAQINLFTRAQTAAWFDSLSAFYPGTLALTGHVEEAEVAHLLFTAIWTRYSAIPERWSTITGEIEHRLPWWPGRPEFIESTWYLYQATQDPWYVHVGEMVLRDIKRRCWTKCGWAGIQDVRTGEQSDRMESFFLGETVKYLHLLFDPHHPLNKLDAPWVFTTEGHPLIIPKSKRHNNGEGYRSLRKTTVPAQVCPAPRKPLPLTVSNTAARSDLFHAAKLARLEDAQPRVQRDSANLESYKTNSFIKVDDFSSPTNDTFYPWTLPKELVPANGTCAPIASKPSYQISFPTPTSLVSGQSLNHRTSGGILMNNLAGVKLGMIQDVSKMGDAVDTFRVNSINNQPIGRDEQLFISKDVIASVVPDTDPFFSRVRDAIWLDVVFDVPKPFPSQTASSATPSNTSSRIAELLESMTGKLDQMSAGGDSDLIEKLAQAGLSEEEGPIMSSLRYLIDRVTSIRSQSQPMPEPTFNRHYFQGITSYGPGAEPLPNVPDARAMDPSTGSPVGDLIWTKIYATDELCASRLPSHIARTHQVLIIKRGGCSFSDKLENIPAVAATKDSLKLVIVVNYPDGRRERDPDSPVGVPQAMLDLGAFLFRPLLDRVQLMLSGVPRRNPLPLIMVGGGDVAFETLRRATALGIKRRYTIQAQGVPIRNVHVL